VAASDFNFADGHVESHKWLDPTTVAYANYLGPNVGMTEAAAQHAGNVDAIWCARHQAGNQNP
jgi:prepilin-type processing-associated H-X9-DG protein